MTDRELMQMALDALEYLATQTRSVYSAEKAIEALRARLAQPEREWQGLTDEDCKEVERWIDFKEDGSGRIATLKLIRYIEAKLKEKNT